jgi:glycosyltransferase involved in cell wall biosynthesis
MKIAQVAPPIERVPPRLYGGTERIVSYLTEELVRQGHEVTLFASGDSQTSAKLVSCCDLALRLNPAVKEMLPYHVLLLEQVRRRASEFDILHFHIDLLHFPMIQPYAERTVTTLHGRLDLPDLQSLYRAFDDVPLVSISYDQRRPMPPVNWVGTVYHGLPRDLLPFRSRAAGGYLAFLGRISPEKRPDLAIEIATRAGVPLKIAAKVDQVDEGYWQEVIEPRIKACPPVEYLGEIDEHEKADFLGNARALLVPIDWPEPFGLVMIEAMSCGTPVIAFRRGSVPEIVEHGRTGFVVNDVEEAVAAVGLIDALDRREIRAHFERRFPVERMAEQYLTVYRRQLGMERAVADVGSRQLPAPAVCDVSVEVLRP